MEAHESFYYILSLPYRTELVVLAVTILLQEVVFEESSNI